MCLPVGLDHQKVLKENFLSFNTVFLVAKINNHIRFTRKIPNSGRRAGFCMGFLQSACKPLDRPL
jgi:hypothetical protein